MSAAKRRDHWWLFKRRACALLCRVLTGHRWAEPETLFIFAGETVHCQQCVRCGWYRQPRQLESYSQGWLEGFRVGRGLVVEKTDRDAQKP